MKKLILSSLLAISILYSSAIASEPTAKEIQEWIERMFPADEPYIDDEYRLKDNFLKQGFNDCTITHEYIENHGGFEKKYNNKYKVTIDMTKIKEVVYFTQTSYAAIRLKGLVKKVEWDWDVDNKRWKNQQFNDSSSTLIYFNYSIDSYKKLFDRFLNAFSTYQKVCNKVNENLF